MTGILDRFRIFRARKRYMRPPATSRAGTALVIALVLGSSILAVTVLERRAAVREREIVEFATARRVDAMMLVADIARARPLLLLGDIVGAPAPKHFAARAISTLATGPGLDFVALEVGSDMQPWIDRYLEGDPEDAAVLVAHPRSIRETDGAGSDYLSVYRRVWQINRELGPDRRIRILALDSPDWPPQRASSPSRILPPFAGRDDHMFATIEERVLQRDARARVLFLVDGIRVLRAPIRIAAGGAVSASIRPLALQLDDAHPGRVGSILVDALGGPGGVAPAIGYRADRLHSMLRRTPGNGSPIAFRTTRDFPGMIADLATTTPPGISLDIDDSKSLADIADGYVRLPN
jgi:hypothetical protein